VPHPFGPPQHDRWVAPPLPPLAPLGPAPAPLMVASMFDSEAEMLANVPAVVDSADTAGREGGGGGGG
jgi:hypothetical protein